MPPLPIHIRPLWPAGAISATTLAGASWPFIVAAATLATLLAAYDRNPVHFLAWKSVIRPRDADKDRHSDAVQAYLLAASTEQPSRSDAEQPDDEAEQAPVALPEPDRPRIAPEQRDAA